MKVISILNNSNKPRRSMVTLTCSALVAERQYVSLSLSTIEDGLKETSLFEALHVIGNMPEQFKCD